MIGSKILKKYISVLLAASLLVGSFSACKKKDKKGDSSSESGAVESQDAQGGVKPSSPAGKPGKPGAIGDPSLEFEPVYGSSLLDTGNLTEKGSGYEGIEATTDYNYGEALQMSILFYELQRSGDLPEQVRCNWRGDSGLKDGSDVGVDLTGGLYDAGDHVKFNLPMAYSGAMLAWSVYEDYESYEKSGQLPYILDNIKWISDYIIKCHTEDEVYYYQVGNGGTDHSWWGPAEVMNMERPSYVVTKDKPGSTVVAEGAACLALTSIVYKDVDPEYSALCLEHAKSLYKFADDTRSDAGYTAATSFYDSWSGFYDELAWAGAWLYVATDDKAYLDNAKACYTQASDDYKWAMCWDDVHIGAAVVLARLTNDDTYSRAVEQHLDFWTTGTSDGERITYTPKGLAWLDNWGSLRYATTTAFIATIYSEWDGCSESKAKTYWDFAVSQAEYALGSTGFSYQIGYGDSYPVHPHHRTAQGSYCDNMNEPGEARHTLYGALVGGPDANDGYTDEVSNYNTNEVACDYNAGFTGLLAKLYGHYYGQTRKDWGAVEPIKAAEYSVEGSVNVSGDDFVEMRTFVYNQTAWPARVADKLEYRYFVDLSEVYAAGGSVTDIEVTTNYMQSGTCNGLRVWDEDAHLYYVSVTFEDGGLAPRGQSNYKCEIQIRLRNPNGPWDNSNDPSYPSLNGGESTTVALYDDGVLVYGSEPGEGGANAGTGVGTGSSGNDSDNNTTPTPSATPAPSNGGNADSDSLTMNVRYDSIGASSNSISGTFEITNKSKSSIDLSSLNINYYIKNTSKGKIVFDCYHAATNSSNGAYNQLSNVTASFDSVKGDKADTCVVIAPGSGTLDSGSTLTISFALHYEDWSTFDSSDDYSAQSVDHIVITSGGKVVFGVKP